MTYQILVSTMMQSDRSILKKMNLHSDSIIINQCDKHGIDVFEHEGFKSTIYSFKERGVGLSRNSALMRATADIIEFADDDMIFTDSHREDVLREFEKHPEADAILFSLESTNPKRPLLPIRRFARVRSKEALKYGCARLAVRREKVLYHNISFSLLFGGGAKYGSGEDTVFLQDCLKAGLKIYKSPVLVAKVSQETSTWFKGYDDQYFFDKGALFAAALPHMCHIYALLSAVKKGGSIKTTIKRFRLYETGIKEYQSHS